MRGVLAAFSGGGREKGHNAKKRMEKEK